VVPDKRGEAIGFAFINRRGKRGGRERLKNIGGPILYPNDF